MNKHKIRISGGPGDYSVQLDDQEIVTAVRGVTFEANSKMPNNTPKATLDLVVREWDIATEADIEIPEKTRDALIALGWTPPAGDR